MIDLSNPESLPLFGIEKIFPARVDKNAKMCSKIIIVAPHPDDETLGCGGAIASLRTSGTAVQVLVISDGTRSHPNSRKYPAPKLKKLREAETLAAMKILGIAPSQVTFCGLPDGAVKNSFAEGKSSICQYLKQFPPTTIFLPWRKDPHPDHQATWQLIDTCIKQMQLAPRLIEYPIWDWDRKQRGEFPPTAKAWRLDISKVVKLKKNAIAQYRSQTTNLIDDDPEGFMLTPEMLQNFTQPWEIYLEI
ncbi:MAG: PIG-L deacetylase family protein [Oscillatoria sp. PMC 1068.18]|nr:PIG-L deacetylase family protein [Oscillatoria sp. PMC 1076.18]MEC4989713.1 PIG-L deacetylase family protein [Oscillatoria sp. PMC 1068.18]